MAVNGADGGDGEGDDAAHELHKLLRKGFLIAAFSRFRALNPGQVQPVGEKFLQGAGDNQGRRAFRRLYRIQGAGKGAYEGRIPAVLPAVMVKVKTGPFRCRSIMRRPLALP